MRSLYRTGRVLFLIFGVLAIALVLMYAASPWLLAGILKQALAGQGLSAMRIELGYPGLRTLPVRHLEFNSVRGGRAFEFRGQDLLVEYDFAGLTAGRLRQLVIPSAQLRVLAAETGVSAPAAAALPLPAAMQAAFPLQKLIVDQLAIDWREPESKPLTGVLRGTIVNTTERLQSRWSLADDQRTLFAFHLDLAADGALTANLFRPEAPAAPLLHAAVTVTPRSTGRLAVYGKLDAQLQPLAALLGPWLALPPAVRGLNGRLVAHWSGELPAAPGQLATAVKIDGRLQLNASVTQLGDLLQTGTLRVATDFALRDNVIRFRLRENLRLAAHLNAAPLALTGSTKTNQFVRTPKPTVLRAPLGVTGQVTLQPDHVQLSLAARTELVVDDIDTADLRIPGLTVQFPAGLDLGYWPGREEWTSTGPVLLITAPAVMPQLAAVGTIEAVAVHAKIEPGGLTPLPPLTVRHAGMTLLGGRVQSRDIRYDSRQPTHAIRVEVEQLDLARVVALEQLQELEATGRLDGQLPVVLSAAGWRVESGRLQATAPGGVIRYRATDSFRAMAESNPNLKLVLQALSNYRYEKLDIGVGYAENGDLDLRVTMAGRNPDWNAGQPINLNLNISENIPMLLRSLRMADDIGTEVEKKARGKVPARP